MRATLIKPNSPLDQLRRSHAATVQSADDVLSPAERTDLKHILQAPMDYVDDPLFHEPEAEAEIFCNAPELPEPNTSWYHPVMDSESVTTGSAKVVNVVLNKAQERALFLQFNYARYRVAELRKRIGSESLSSDDAREIIHWYRRSRELRDQIAEFNLALVLAMSKRVRARDVEFADLISEGNMALLRSIDKFDVSKGFKFSTYACRAILKGFSRIGIKGTKYRTMFPTDFDPKLERADHASQRFEDLASDCAAEVREIVRKNRADLTDVEAAVIGHRFALDKTTDAAPLTLEQVGRLVGLTKERVRQIQNKALDKIRLTLESEFINGSDSPNWEDA